MIPQNTKIRWPLCNHLFLITCSLFTSSISHAALFDCISETGYCIGEGNTLIFKYTGSTSSLGLFGTVEVIGDSIVSSPTNFRAESNNGGTASVNDNREIQIIAKPGYQIDGINITEGGEYLMSGAINSVSVDVDGWSDVGEWNNYVFGPSVQQTLLITGNLTNNDGSTHSWEGSANTSLTGPEWDGINHIGLVLQNNLIADTLTSGETAWIDKNSIDISVITSAIPVPAAVWLFVSGLMGLSGFARRKKI
jgi:hypothetical protein